MSLGVYYALQFHLIIVCNVLPVVNFHYVLHAKGYRERGRGGGKRGQCILKET